MYFGVSVRRITHTLGHYFVRPTNNTRSVQRYTGSREWETCFAEGRPCGVSSTTIRLRIRSTVLMARCYLRSIVALNFLCSIDFNVETNARKAYVYLIIHVLIIKI